MKLSRFITDHIEEILEEWESFARTMEPAATGMSTLALRDHAKLMLEELVLDIETKQNPEQQQEKSQGLAPDGEGDEVSAAATHGTLRQISGFTLLQLTAEFRALRATVLRLWLPHVKAVTEASTNDMVRFNETIDQALSESVVNYSNRATRTRDTFLAILGHDLRMPLASMTLTGDILAFSGADPAQTVEIGQRIQRSAATMTSMVNDLLEYSRTQLGDGMPITPEQADAAEICQAALHDASAAYPECRFEFDAAGDLTGTFDKVRLQQAVTNLLSNAAQYRGKEHPVTISAQGDVDDVLIQVRNFGPIIPADSLEAIFNPLVQLSVEQEHAVRPSTSMGLGLFIVREITEAHGGRITVDSDEESGTIFSVRLPRWQPAE